MRRVVAQINTYDFPIGLDDSVRVHTRWSVICGLFALARTILRVARPLIFVSIDIMRKNYFIIRFY